MGLQIWPYRATSSSCCILDLQKLTGLFLIATFQQSGGQSTVSDDPADDSRNKCVISGFPLTVAFDKHPSKEKKQS